jgi:heme A synthase
MALPDPQFEAPRDRRRERRDRVLGVLAAGGMGAAIALWVAEAGGGEPILVAGFTSKLLVAAALLVAAWLILSVERRLGEQLRGIEASRFRDGYAAGYLDAATRFRGGNDERPSLRPVK